MLGQWIRCFYSDNGTLIDRSLEAQNSDTLSFQIVAAEDYLYVGQYYPFNNLFFEVGSVVNAVASLATVQYWDGTTWRTAVDVLDQTKASGASMARNGVIQWSPNQDYQWSAVQDTSDTGSPTELQTLTIYDLYWVRIKWSANFTASTVLKNIGYAFTTTQTLYSLDSEMNQYLVAWGGSTKTNWDEQIMVASQQMVADLRARGFVAGAGNIIRFDDVFLPCAYLTLSLIYQPLGSAFNDRKTDARAQYKKLLNLTRFTVDQNNNARPDPSEINNVVARGIR